MIYSIPVSSDTGGLPDVLLGTKGLLTVTDQSSLRFHDQSKPGKLSGVYFLCRHRKVLYVGESGNLESRFVAHKHRIGPIDIFYIHVHQKNRKEIEGGYIWLLEPPLNRRLKSVVMDDIEAEFAILGKLQEYRSTVNPEIIQARKKLPTYIRYILKFADMLPQYKSIFDEFGFDLPLRSKNNTSSRNKYAAKNKLGRSKYDVENKAYLENANMSECVM